MVHQLKVCAVLEELGPRTHVRQVPTACNSIAPGDLIPSSSLPRHCTLTVQQVHSQTKTHTHKIQRISVGCCTQFPRLWEPWSSVCGFWPTLCWQIWLPAKMAAMLLQRALPKVNQLNYQQLRKLGERLCHQLWCKELEGCVEEGGKKDLF